MNDNNEQRRRRNSKWGTYWIAGLLVAAVCLGVLIYIGWIDNNNHVDSRDGDNVTQNYIQDTNQPNSPGVNDWNNPDGSSLREVIVDHAVGTDTVMLPE